MYLDGSRVDQDQVSIYHRTDLRAVEVFNQIFNVPMGYDSRGCGVVLFWTKRTAGCESAPFTLGRRRPHAR